MRGKKAEQTEKTRALICEAARELFNAEGTGNVHTHDIAARAGISPGNLYYHYANKQEIIRELFKGVELFDAEAWKKSGPVHSGGSFLDFTDFFFGSIKRHRYFFRELAALLRDDEVLASAWRAAYANLQSIMRQTARHWAETGVMKPFADDEELDAFIDNGFIIAGFFFTFLDAKEGRSGKGTYERGAALLARFLWPYHTARGQKLLKQRLLQK